MQGPMTMCSVSDAVRPSRPAVSASTRETTRATGTDGWSVLADCSARSDRDRPDLAAVGLAWDRRSDAVRPGILALVRASRPGSNP